MRFSELIYGVEALDVSGDADVTGVQYDSRKVRPGDCFVAMKGETTDGNAYMNLAVQSGATAIVSDSQEQARRSGVAWATVAHGRRALAAISANFFGRPAEKLALTGVTGTNGKTTITFLLEAMLAAAGRRSAVIGTIEYRIAGKAIAAPHTTPESLELNQFFSGAVSASASEAVMEVSSHALDQERVYGLHYDVAVFTNLTRDHLDYHLDMKRYFAAKQKLFSGMGAEPPRVAVINTDDEYGRVLAAISRSARLQVLTYGFEGADVVARKSEMGSEGTRFDLVTPFGEIAMFSPLVGRVNVYNVLGAAAAALSRGCALQQVHEAVLKLPQVPGRFQRVNAGQPFSVVVDYAHTDDALRNLTSVAREFVQRNQGRVLTVFGCGGDRDRRKRPLMGEAVGKGSDFTVLTSDNPRSEDPLGIIHDALIGLIRSGADYTVEPDRQRAINLAVRLARPGDIVLIAGKGHEKVQITAEGVFPFDDVDVARRALYRAGYTEDFAGTLPGVQGAGQ